MLMPENKGKYLVKYLLPRLIVMVNQEKLRSSGVIASPQEGNEVRVEALKERSTIGGDSQLRLCRARSIIWEPLSYQSPASRSGIKEPKANMSHSIWDGARNEKRKQRVGGEKKKANWKSRAAEGGLLFSWPCQSSAGGFRGEHLTAGFHIKAHF